MVSYDIEWRDVPASTTISGFCHEKYIGGTIMKKAKSKITAMVLVTVSASDRGLPSSGT